MPDVLPRVKRYRLDTFRDLLAVPEPHRGPVLEHVVSVLGILDTAAKAGELGAAVLSVSMFRHGETVLEVTLGDTVRALVAPAVAS